MICNKCHTQAVKNTALSKEFWYCRTCKDEVSEYGNPVSRVKAAIEENGPFQVGDTVRLRFPQYAADTGIFTIVELGASGLKPVRLVCDDCAADYVQYCQSVSYSDIVLE